MSKLIEFSVPDKMHALLQQIGSDFGLGASGIARHIVFDTLIKGGFRVAAEAEQEPEGDEETAQPEPEPLPGRGTESYLPPTPEMVGMIQLGEMTQLADGWQLFDLGAQCFKDQFNANMPLPPDRYVIYSSVDDGRDENGKMKPGCRYPCAIFSESKERLLREVDLASKAELSKAIHRPG